MSKTTAMDRLRALIEDPEFVSDEQRAAIESDGNFVLTACPGSGKTRTVGLRGAWNALSRGWRVAATSYTNVAVAEIRAAAAAAGVVLAREHFVGTLHSFLLRFVFYPFGHLIMGCDGQPTLVVDPGDCPMEPDKIWLGDNTRWGDVWMFDFRADGTFAARKPPNLYMTPEEIVEIGGVKASEVKNELFMGGYASHSDSMFIAMRVLEEQQEVAELVAARFDEIIVDEVQDTSDVQLGCLELIKKTQWLRSLVLVGDPDQAIYEWQGSDPTACLEFAAAHGLTELSLTKNFRSSQAICDVTFRVAGRSAADDASGTHRGFAVPPEIIMYPEPDAAGALTRFAARLGELDIDVGDAPVLARTQSFADKINRVGNIDASWSVKALGAAAALFQDAGSLDAGALARVETVLRRIAWGRTTIDNVAIRLRLRSAAAEVVRALPALDGATDLKTWIAGARATVHSAVTSLEDNPVSKASNVIKSKRDDDKRTTREAFTKPLIGPVARTVHSAKGESHPAVLLIAAKKSGDRDNAREWIRSELGGAINEETRIGYVAVTRAQRYCAIALPVSTEADVVDAYLRAGFVALDG